MAKFTNDQKARAVKRYLEGNEGYLTIAKEIGVHNRHVQYWERKYEFHAFNYSLDFKLDKASTF
ncbi:transposase [Mesobacillus foraminis]|uniref:transposase n=1 Tax=Mesobacillus foraminis TaxID=279826 RepID=UPI001BE566E8|nr:transposase [Mesobacillus foraminis]MBT2757785.1 transposase [Mesobacillus foraminis]